MTFDERRDRALAIMARTPVPFRRYAPPILQLLWRLRLPVPPPHFGSDWLWQLTNVVCVAIAVMPDWLFRDRGPGMWIFAFAVGGLVRAMVSARGYAREAERLELPAWEDLDGAPARRDSILGLSEPASAPDRDR